MSYHWRDGPNGPIYNGLPPIPNPPKVEQRYETLTIDKLRSDNRNLSEALFYMICKNGGGREYVERNFSQPILLWYDEQMRNNIKQVALLKLSDEEKKALGLI